MVRTAFPRSADLPLPLRVLRSPVLRALISSQAIFTSEISPTDSGRPLGLRPLASDDYRDYGTVLTCMPILIGILTAVDNRFRSNTKYRVLRWASDAVRSEIFNYRSNCGDFGSASLPERNKLLRKRISTIAEDVLSTAVIEGSLGKPRRENNNYVYAVEGGASPAPGQPPLLLDDAFSNLTPDDYMRLRVLPEAAVYLQRAQAAQRALSRLQVLVYLLGGLGTLLATFNLQILVAITTATTTALNTVAEKENYGGAVLVYNRAVTQLTNVQGWWNALSAVEQVMALPECRPEQQGGAQTMP